MRKFVLAVLAMFAAQAGFSGTVVMTEDFEDAGYVVGAAVNSNAASPVKWTMGDVVGGAATIENVLIGAGSKGAYFNDTSSEAVWGLKIGMYTDAMAAGIQKGTIQFTVRGGTLTGTAGAGGNPFTIRAYDAYPAAVIPPATAVSVDTNRCLFTLTFGQTGGAPSKINFQYNTDLATPPVHTTIQSVNNWVIATDYKVTVDFDSATRLMTFQVLEGATETPVAFDPAGSPGPYPFQADMSWAGLKGLLIDTPNVTNRSPKLQLDNVTVTEEASGPAPEVAVTVDAADVADGGTVDFGTPAVGVPTSKTFTVANTGTADLTTSNLVLPTGYALAAGSDLAATIAQGTSDDFIVELDTASAGVKNGEITFDTNDSDENPFNISVTANVGSTSVEDWTER